MTTEAAGLSLTALRVTDLDRSRRFWAEGCGMPVRSSFSTPKFDAVLVGREGAAGLELVRQHGGEQGPVGAGGGFWKVVLSTGDAAAAVRRAAEHGGTVVRSAQALEHLGGLVLGLVEDPDGYLVEFVQQPG
jgi:catechol 2,3-dioxygenase-like lactoylglutathione lyase family enzyme